MTAIVDVESYGGESRTSRLFSSYPIRLIESLLQHRNMKKRYRDDNDDNDNTISTIASFVTIFILGFGGGSVSGDSNKFSINVGKNASICIRTQGNSKIYRTEQQTIQKQMISCNIMAKGFLVMIPDHTVCYEDANYKQEHVYNLITGSSNDDDKGSLVIVDWISSGRLHGGRKESSPSLSSGEFWKLRRLRSTIQVNDNDTKQCLFLDNIDLYNSYDENNDLILSISDKVGGASIFGLIILSGQKTLLLRERVSVLMQRQSFQKMKESVNNNKNDNDNDNDNDRKGKEFFYREPLVSVSTLSSSLVVVRFATGCVEDAYILVQEILKPLGKDIGTSPYADKVVHTNDEGRDWHCIKELRDFDKKKNILCDKIHS